MWLRIVIIILFFIRFSYCQENLLAITQEEYSTRRHKLLEMIDSGSVVAMKSADYKLRSNDVEYRYRQESNFLYLTGWKSPNRYILISRNGIDLNDKHINILLFTSSKEESIKTQLKEDEAIINVNRFQDLFKTLLKDGRTLYIIAPDIPFVNDWLNDKQIFLEKNAKKELEQKFPNLKVKNAQSLFGKLREIKTAAELNLIRKSIELTWNGIKRAMVDCKPGMWEYELQADIEYEMTRGGANSPSWTPIIGSGENSLILHYDENCRQMKAGELVVIDVGAEYNGYSCDITRTIPVSGRFSKAQAEVYNAVLHAQNEVIKIIKPGITMKDMDEKAKEVITQAGYEKYIRHGVTHPLGIDVHDVWASDTIQAGMVLTVEPGIYIPQNAEDVSSEYRGFGIRIEDDVLVTETGCEVLTMNVPKEIYELEKIMGKK